MQRNPKNDAGRALPIIIVIMVLLAIGIGVGIYKTKSRTTYQQQAQREAIAAKERQEADQKINLARAAQEREALQKATEAAKSKDILVDALKDADSLLARWEDAVTIANSTARMSLSAPVSNLQGIKREATSLAVPPCLQTGKDRLLEGMGLTVDGYLAFMLNTAKLGEVAAMSKFEEAKPHFESFRADRKLCPTL